MILGEWGRRVWYVVNRGRLDRELAEEMAAHREMMDEPQRFGNALRLREDAREAWVVRWLDEVWQDLKHAGRTLARARGFTVTAVLILSLGLGLNLAFFQFLDVVALRPPNVRSPETLVRFDRRSKNFRSNGIPYPATQFIRQHNSVLSAALMSRNDRVRWEDDTAWRPIASYVSTNWFAELGYGAALGRVFVESLDERVDAPNVVIVSDAFWRTRLQQAADVIGRSVRVNDQLATIVGVAPVDFPDLEFSARQVELWLPLSQIDRFNPGTDIKEAWGAHSTGLYGRLRPGVSAEAAREGLRATMDELARMRPVEFTPGETLEPHLGTNGFRGPDDTKELLLIASLIGTLTLLVLLVTCANIGNLVLSHAIGRLRELGVRAALGASRWRILRQQLIESLVLAALGAAAGLLLGNWSLRMFAAQASLPRYLHLEPDVRTLAVAAAIAVVSTIAFGVVPAWMVSRRDLVGGMKEGGYGSSRGLARTRFRLVLIGTQVMGCCVLLIVAGLVVRGLQRLLVADLGFDFEQVVVMDASPGQSGIRGPAARVYWEDVKRSIEAQPDVAMIALTSQVPLGDDGSRSFYNDAPGLTITTAQVEPSFFGLMSIPLIAGRNFRAEDDASRVTIISRRLAMRMYGSLDVLGKVFPKSGTGLTIIGVSEDAPLAKPGATTVAEQYTLIGRDDYGQVAILARTRGNPAQLLAPMRAAARAADSRVFATAQLMRTSYERKLRTRRSASVAAGVTGLLALTLACVGIFGVVTYGVAMRTREIGIRRALGAAPQTSLVWFCGSF